MKKPVILFLIKIYLDIYNEMDSIKYKKNESAKKLSIRKNEDVNVPISASKRDSYLGNKRGWQNDIFEYTGN